MADTERSYLTLGVDWKPSEEQVPGSVERPIREVLDSLEPATRIVVARTIANIAVDSICETAAEAASDPSDYIVPIAAGAAALDMTDHEARIKQAIHTIAE